MGMVSCNDYKNENEALKRQIDSLKIANASLLGENISLQNDLNAYRYSPSKLLANIRQSYAKKKYNEMKNDIALLNRYHPESSECVAANKIYSQALKEQELAKKKEEARKAKEEKGSFAGTYYCYRTHDTYVFKSNNTGYFQIQGGDPSGFTWKRSGNIVTISYKIFGKQKLRYDSKSQTLIEKSESFGTLVFNKQ
jgi:hypothetical protein